MELWSWRWRRGLDASKDLQPAGGEGKIVDIDVQQTISFLLSTFKILISGISTILYMQVNPRAFLTLIDKLGKMGIGMGKITCQGRLSSLSLLQK